MYFEGQLQSKFVVRKINFVSISAPSLGSLSLNINLIGSHTVNSFKSLKSKHFSLYLELKMFIFLQSFKLREDSFYNHLLFC